jgi:hypothetical protein
MNPEIVNVASLPELLGSLDFDIDGELLAGVGVALDASSLGDEFEQAASVRPPAIRRAAGGTTALIITRVLVLMYCRYGSEGRFVHRRSD